MSILPTEYGWIEQRTPLPRMIAEAIRLYGTEEAPLTKDNPVILAWAKEVGGSISETYLADATPWCGLFMAVVAKRAGKTPPAGALWALNWKKFGEEAGQPAFGDVLVFERPGGGHVGLYVGEDAKNFYVLGGNQNDRVCIGPQARKRLKAARRPLYMNQPASVKPIVLAGGDKTPITTA